METMYCHGLLVRLAQFVSADVEKQHAERHYGLSVAASIVD
jgi:hypothetical protein